MIIDKELEFSDGQAITADAASTNVVDMGHTENWSAGERLHVRYQVDTTFTDLTSLDLIIQTDTVEAFSSPTTLHTQNVLLAALTAGAEFHADIPISGVEQYVRVYYDSNGTDPTAGAISAFVEVYDAPEGDVGAITGVT